MYKNALKKRQKRINTETLAIIDRISEAFGANIPYLRSYRTDLVPLVRQTGRYLDGLLDLIPGPAALDPDHWDQDPMVHSICVSGERTDKLISDSEALERFFQHSQNQVAFALLTAEKKVKTVSGTEKNGEIIRRDVLQKALFFEGHQIRVPTDTLEKTRRQGRLLLFSELFSQAVDKYSAIKQWRAELEVQHDEITAKMAFYKDRQNHEEIDDLHDSIEDKMEEIDAAFDSPEDYMAHLRQFLQNPEQYLTAKSVFLRVSPLGILLSDASTQRAYKFPLAEFESGSGNKWVATWIRVQRGSFSAKD